MWEKNEQLKRLVEKEPELAVQTFNPYFTPLFNTLKCILKNKEIYICIRKQLNFFLQSNWKGWAIKMVVEQKEAELAVQTFNPFFTPLFNTLKCILKN